MPGLYSEAGYKIISVPGYDKSGEKKKVEMMLLDRKWLFADEYTLYEVTISKCELRSVIIMSRLIFFI